MAAAVAPLFARVGDVPHVPHVPEPVDELDPSWVQLYCGDDCAITERQPAGDVVTWQIGQTADLATHAVFFDAATGGNEVATIELSAPGWMLMPGDTVELELWDWS